MLLLSQYDPANERLQGMRTSGTHYVGKTLSASSHVSQSVQGYLRTAQPPGHGLDSSMFFLHRSFVLSKENFLLGSHSIILSPCISELFLLNYKVVHARNRWILPLIAWICNSLKWNYWHGPCPCSFAKHSKKKYMEIIHGLYFSCKVLPPEIQTFVFLSLQLLQVAFHICKAQGSLLQQVLLHNNLCINSIFASLQCLTSIAGLCPHGGVCFLPVSPISPKSRVGLLLLNTYSSPPSLFLIFNQPVLSFKEIGRIAPHEKMLLSTTLYVLWETAIFQLHPPLGLLFTVLYNSKLQT